jgi:hypothetical protein
MVAVDAEIIEVLCCDNASMRCIFKGEKPANCQRKHRQVPVNPKTAKALGSTVPSSLLVRADGVIE